MKNHSSSNSAAPSYVFWACLLKSLNKNTEELDRFWSRLSMMQHKNFQREVGKVWFTYSKEGINKAMKEK